IGRVVGDLEAAADRAATRGLTSRMILVDAGSTDGTADRAMDAAKRSPIDIGRHATSRGPGCAYASGLSTDPSPMCDHALVLPLEADNPSRLEIRDRMLMRADEGYDAVFASPYAYGGGIVETTPIRTTLSHLANLFVKELLGIHGLLTVSSFFRLY